MGKNGGIADMSLWFYFCGAYILVWAILIFYVYSIWRKQGELISRVESMERHGENSKS